MGPSEQLTVDRGAPVEGLGLAGLWGMPHSAAERGAAERAAREALRAQVAKLERELSGIVAGGFPHIHPGAEGAHRAGAPAGRMGPHLLTLAELEQLRDRLALRVRAAQESSARRSELEWRARELLEQMKLEPGRYRFVRLPVVALGERGCGVWEVRPRLGLIGMLAGWWQLKLSSGCPLPGAARSRRAASPGTRQRGPKGASRPGRA